VSDFGIPSWSLDTAAAIMEMVRVKDQETYHHCVRVSQGTRLLARAAGLSELDQKIAEFAGLFHDIGKVGVPDEILLKPSKLTDAEYEIMKSHPVKSVQILQPLSHIPFFRMIMPGVLHHHERYDGRGYPHGLKGEDIPITARLVLVADTYDAITAHRAYRQGRTPQVAYQELRDFAGRQFDPHLVKIFLEAHPTWTERDRVIFQEMNETVLKAA
jgi:putative nucleotidyltransferase with HDIG domain